MNFGGHNSAHHKHLQNLAPISRLLESLPKYSQAKLIVDIPTSHYLFFFRLSTALCCNYLSSKLHSSPLVTLRLETFQLRGYLLYILIPQQWVGALGTAGL